LQQIKEHSFFKGVNWKKQFNRSVRPPFVPDNLSLDNLGTDSNEELAEKHESNNSYDVSKVYSGTGGTRSHCKSVRRDKSPSKVLGDYHLKMINRAFADF
jgi:hypothetical protein